MRLTESLVFYGLVGLSCGIYQVRQRRESREKQVLLIVMSVLFWPLLLPILAAGEPQPRNRRQTPQKPGPYRNEIQSAIQRVEDAISDAEGTAGRLLAKELEVLDAIAQQLQWLDSKLEEITTLRREPTFSLDAIEEELQKAEANDIGATALENLAIKRHNAQQMERIQGEYTQRIEDSLALLGRIHSQITLLRFSGSPSPQLDMSADQLLTLLDTLQETTAL